MNQTELQKLAPGDAIMVSKGAHFMQTQYAIITERDDCGRLFVRKWIRGKHRGEERWSLPSRIANSDIIRRAIDADARQKRVKS